MLPGELQELVRHMEWADALVWSSVLALPQAHSDSRLRWCLRQGLGVPWACLRSSWTPCSQALSRPP